MFTGIIETTGTIASLERRGPLLAVRVAGAPDLPIGGSIALNGCCVTAVEVVPQGFLTELTEETLVRTSFAERLKPGVRVNLERAMRSDGRFDGHIVQGHVDGVGRIRELQRKGDAAVPTVGGDGGFAAHTVRGHVDGLGRTRELQRKGDAAEVTIELPEPL